MSSGGSTALTIGVAVVLAYAVLFALVLLSAAVFVEGGYLRSTLGHRVDPADYSILAWMKTSLSTVAGALGSGLEDEDAVRDAAYGCLQNDARTRTAYTKARPRREGGAPLLTPCEGLRVSRRIGRCPAQHKACVT